jgi:O-antigen ligase
MLANLYALKMIGKDPSMLIFGYGDDLLNIMGIPADLPYELHSRILNTRLTTSHNSTIYLIQRMGLVMGILYVYMFSSILTRFIRKENVGVITSYIVGSMLMHTFYSSVYSIFFFLILSSSIWVDSQKQRNVLKLSVKYKKNR